jgi:hypothetical protein
VGIQRASDTEFARTGYADFNREVWNEDGVAEQHGVAAVKEFAGGFRPRNPPALKTEEKITGEVR